jgi:hypothetical protein
MQTNHFPEKGGRVTSVPGVEGCRDGSKCRVLMRISGFAVIVAASPAPEEFLAPAHPPVACPTCFSRP